ncbi:MAG: sigma-70 family RNA polymerase sigma factor [Clostridia bacterium]|nr:sigma-70 family RNA polymerase sigma factor [Clostridia bacterium]
MRNERNERNEAERMARVCAGDREAFEALVEAYWPVARRTAYGILRDAALSEDVAQDCFADLYLHRRRYRPRFSFQAYVAAIARHKSIDLLRRREGRRSSVFHGQADPDAGSPESAYIRALYRHTLLAAVERLPEGQRRMLAAYAIEGASYRQIAEELGVTVAQVKAGLHRARRALRRVKEEWER